MVQDNTNTPGYGTTAYKEGDGQTEASVHVQVSVIISDHYCPVFLHIAISKSIALPSLQYMLGRVL